MLFGSAGSYGLALAAALLVGAGSGAMEVVANALAADLYPEKRAFLLNALQVAFGVGAAASPTLCRYLLTHGTDWRWLYFGLAAINIVVFVILSLCRIPKSAAPEALELSVLRTVLQKPSFAMLCVMQALYVGAEVSFFSWLPTYFEKQLPGGAVWMAGVGTLFWITMTIGRFGLGGLLGRYPLMRLTALCAGGGVLFAALALLLPTLLPVLVCVALTGLCIAGIFSLVLAEAGERFPRCRRYGIWWRGRSGRSRGRSDSLGGRCTGIQSPWLARGTGACAPCADRDALAQPTPTAPCP